MEYAFCCHWVIYCHAFPGICTRGGYQKVLVLHRHLGRLRGTQWSWSQTRGASFVSQLLWGTIVETKPHPKGKKIVAKKTPKQTLPPTPFLSPPKTDRQKGKFKHLSLLEGSINISEPQWSCLSCRTQVSIRHFHWPNYLFVLISIQVHLIFLCLEG